MSSNPQVKGPHANPTAIERAREEPQPLRLLGIIHVLLRSRREIATAVLAIVAPFVLLQMTQPRTFSVDASFVPQARRTSNALAGVASQLGLSTALQTDANASPAFYADLVRSRVLLSQVAAESIQVTIDGKRQPKAIADIYRINRKSSAETREAVIEQLSKEITSNTVQKTGVVNLRVTNRDPGLALAISQRLLELMNEFNLNVRQSQASAERRFSEVRLAEVKASLIKTEATLATFLISNRSVDRSPILQYQQEGLEREVALQQELHRTLSAAYEQARIDEVRDTPVITVLQSPEYPVRPNGRGIIPKTLLALFLSAIIGITWGTLKWRTHHETEDELREREQVSRLLRDTLYELRRPWRILTTQANQKPQ